MSGQWMYLWNSGSEEFQQSTWYISNYFHFRKEGFIEIILSCCGTCTDEVCNYVLGEGVIR